MKRALQAGFALGLLALVFACAAEPSSVEDVAPEQVLALAAAPDGPLLLDVRTPEEYEGGHVPGAVNIPHDQVTGRLAELEPYRDRGVVVYCQSGRRAGMAAEALVEAGLPVRHLDGDMAGWRERNLPIER
jgi:rhodanese-related sulfurtransferase